MMDATEHDNNETETSPFQDVCPRHGERINRHHSCPKCVMEEVRRNERRIHLPLGLEHDAPLELEPDAVIQADPLGSVNPINIEIG